MRISLSFVSAIVLALGPVSVAAAQHADFVLFGDSNPAAADVPAEQRFAHPITAPYFHEDSFVTFDARAWYLYHDAPNASPIGGGNAHAAAFQLRLLSTERLQFVAYKDGSIWWDSGLVEDKGLIDIGAAHCPVVIEVRDDGVHESFTKGQRFFRIPQVVCQ